MHTDALLLGLIKILGGHAVIDKPAKAIPDAALPSLIAKVALQDAIFDVATHALNHRLALAQQ